MSWSSWCSRGARRWISRQRGRVLLAGLGLCACGLIGASEALAAPPLMEWSATVNGFAATKKSSGEAACSAATDAHNAARPASPFVFTTVTYVSAVRGYCRNYEVGKPEQERDFGLADGIYTNVCADGKPADMTKPIADRCGVAGPVCTDQAVKDKYRGAMVQGTGALPNLVCIQGCSYNTGSVGVSVGTTYATDLGQGTGATCSGANYDLIDTTTKKDDPPSPTVCARSGKVYGTVNGVGICAAAGSIPGSTVKQTGSQTETNTSASGVQAPPQTTTTTTTVTNVDGRTYVTTTTTHPGGGKTETTQDQESFCQQNPSSSLCKEGSAAGGDDCGAPPACQGDAVQCMMVKQQWFTRCDNQQPNAASDLGALMVAGQDPVKNPASSANRTVTPIDSAIDQTAFLGNGALTDKVFTVSGQSITFPFSRLNQYLEWLGRLFVVISLIGALRIVLGGFK